MLITNNNFSFTSKYNVDKPDRDSHDTSSIFDSIFDYAGNKKHFFWQRICHTQKPSNVLKYTIANDRISQLETIESEDEYYSSLKEIIKYISPKNKDGYNVPYLTMDGYNPNVNELSGLIPYCGINDRSMELNAWLSGRKSPSIPMLCDNEMANIVNVFEYSLKKLDEKYGTYSGTVFRRGFFNPNTDKQFYSTSISSTIISKFKGKILLPSPATQYSVIKVKNGHRILNFQKDSCTSTGKYFYDTEKEILIDRKSRFREVPPKEYTKDDIKRISLLISKLIRNTPDDYMEIYKTYKNLTRYIKVWEEI